MLIKTSSTNQFPKIQADGLVHAGNFFNPSATAAGDISYDLNIPLSDDSDPCGSSLSGMCSYIFRGVGNNANPGGVPAYPSRVLGSLGGRYETYGVECGESRVLSGERDSGVSPSPVYDLWLANRAVKLPSFIKDLPKVEIYSGFNFTSDKKPNINGFIDSYWYDTTQNPPTRILSGTLNGVNATQNRLWNPNIWYYHPNVDEMWEARQAGNFQQENLLIRQYTGGTVVGEVFLGGNMYKLVFKHETGGNNNTFYVAFVLVEQKNKKPNHHTYYLNYDNVKDYMLSQEFWDLAKKSPVIALMQAEQTAPRKSRVVVRPNTQMVIDGISDGFEYWGNNDGDDTSISQSTGLFVVTDENESLTFGKGEVFSDGDSFCRLPIRILSDDFVYCKLPITVIGNFGCRLPIRYSSRLYQQSAADCVSCPQLEEIPKVLAPYGSGPIVFRPDNLFYFPAESLVNLTDYSHSGLDGSFTALDNQVHYQPPESGCDSQCGKLSLYFDYQCPEGGVIVPETGAANAETGEIDLSDFDSLGEPGEPELGAAKVVILNTPVRQTGEVVITPIEDAIVTEVVEPEPPVTGFKKLSCSVDITICSFADAEVLADECIVLGEHDTEYLIPVLSTDIPPGEEACEVSVSSSCANVKWTGEGYLFSIRPRASGIFPLLVPSHPAGEKAHASMRCVTIQVTPKVGQSLNNCCAVLMAKQPCDSVYKPVGKISETTLNVTQIAPDTFEDFENCQLVIPDNLRDEWTITGTVELQAGGMSLQGGVDYDIKLVMDIKNPTLATFEGSARASGFSVNLGAGGKKSNTINLQGFGGFCAQGFRY